MFSLSFLCVHCVVSEVNEVPLNPTRSISGVTLFFCLFFHLFSFVSMTLKTLHAKGRQSERKDCHMPEFYILHDTTPPTRPHIKGPILRPSPLQVSSISVIVQITFWRGGGKKKITFSTVFTASPHKCLVSTPCLPCRGALAVPFCDITKGRLRCPV